VKFVARDFYLMQFSNRATRCGESHTLHTGDLDKIWYKKLLSGGEFSENRRRECCTILLASMKFHLRVFREFYDILEVKNAFVKSMYCIMEHTVCSLIHSEK
jgi:hypothetical protein